MIKNRRMEIKGKDSVRKYKISDDKIKQRDRIGGEVEEKDNEQPISK